MRVVLINVGFMPGEADLRVAPPFGIMTVGAYLRQKGFDVALLDWSGEPIDGEKRAILERMAPDVVGVHVKISSAITRAVEVSQWAHAMGATVLWGGPGPAILADVMLDEGPVDYLVMGEGEVTTAELLEALKNGSDPHLVNGIAFRERGKVVRSLPRDRIMDLDTLPFPLWEDLGDLSRYHVPLHGRNVVPIVTSRGCPGNCTFCYSKSMWGFKWNARSPEKVVEEMRRLLAYDPQLGGFIIMDDLFATDPGRVGRICTMIQENGLDVVWNCEIRADMINEGLLKNMKAAGCTQVLMGIESGSQRLLDLIRKDITVEDIRRACKLIREADMEIYAMLVNALPTETMDDIRATDQLLKETRPDFTEFLVYMPYPGTALFDLAVEEGFVAPTTLDGWARMGTFDLRSVEDKGITSATEQMYEHVAKGAKRRAVRDSYIRELKKEPLTAPVRGLKFLFKRGEDKG
jgi:anaerobic magnesium-protoporphyrin IX monomethyl ester cyclase